jgi:hypothetical protein
VDEDSIQIEILEEEIDMAILKRKASKLACIFYLVAGVASHGRATTI